MSLPKVTAPTYELELPSSGKKVKYRPFLVKEEKVLLIALDSKDEKQITQAIIDVLKACIITRGIKVDSLPSFDLEFIFLKIRGASVGEDIVVNVKCMDDKTTEVAHTINIDEVKVYKPKGHTDKIMINKTVGVIMKYPSLNHFIDIGFLDDKELDGVDILCNSIDQIFDGEDVTEAKECSRKELVTFVESLTQAQFQKISKFFETMPKLKHDFTVTNPNTGKESEYTLEGLQSFFV